jgi:hypothetical protein
MSANFLGQRRKLERLVKLNFHKLLPMALGALDAYVCSMFHNSIPKNQSTVDG